MEKTEENNKEEFTRKIGNTTYHVTVHFADNTTKTFADGIRDLIKNQFYIELKNIHPPS